MVAAYSMVEMAGSQLEEEVSQSWVIYQAEAVVPSS